jgi:cbb3-type cytochrome oxidase subunit 3
MENDRGTEETWTDWDGGNRGAQIGTVAGIALALGVIVYLFRRSRREEPAIVAAANRASDSALSLFGDDFPSAGRELFNEKVVPELKPVLRTLLRELEGVLVQYIRRAERTIDDL